MLRWPGQALRHGRRRDRTNLDRRSRGRGRRSLGPAVAGRTGRAARAPPRRHRTADPGRVDGVHVGHRRVLETARAAGLRTTVVTFWPHPRIVLGNRVELLTTLDRRLELLAETGMDEALVVEFTSELARLDPREFAESLL